MNPIAIPSIIMLIAVALLSVVGAIVLRKTWHKNLALSLAIFEIAIAAFLVIVGHSYR